MRTDGSFRIWGRDHFGRLCFTLNFPFENGFRSLAPRVFDYPAAFLDNPIREEHIVLKVMGCPSWV